jgi:hypothetical protein
MKKSKYQLPQRVRRCPVCGKGPFSRAVMFQHILRAHVTVSEKRDMLEDAYYGIYPGVKKFREVVDSKRKQAQEVMELERIYALPSGRVVRRKKKQL